MRKTCRLVVALMILSPDHALGQDVPPVTIFPGDRPTDNLMFGPNHYTLNPSNFPSRRINLLKIPDNSTIAITGDVSLQVDTLHYGSNATITLTPNVNMHTNIMFEDLHQPPPATEHQASYCTHGNIGRTGNAGKAGPPGYTLTMFGIKQVIGQGGNLWIETDGVSGEYGGYGGDGQKGGGHEGGIGGCGGKPGGAGGYGGKGGAGGDSATVIIRQADGVDLPVIRFGDGNTCPPSGRPHAASDGSGAIVISGLSGCDGLDGPRGQPGGGG